MKPKIWGVALGSLLLLFLTACESDSSRAPYDAPSPAISTSNYTGKKIALVIGNWAYRFKPLNNPQNDARDMAQLLRQLDFKVIHKENLGFEEMEDEVIQFKLELKKKGQVGLFYFAGHGLEVEGINYLLPTDLRKPETQLIKRKSIEAQWVVDVMEHAGSEVNIVIMDACRTFPRPDKPRATSKDYGFAAMNAPKGTLIGFATSSGQSTPDGKKGSNGLYTGHLLKFMRQPGLTIEEVFKKTRQQVAWETRNKQVPPVYNSLIGDFCLVSCAKPKPDQEKILQAQLEQERQKFEQERREKEVLLEQERRKLEQERREKEALLEQERREKEALQAQLEALKNQPKPVVPQPSQSNEFAPLKVFRDRLADGSFGPEMVWIPAGSFRMGDIQGDGDSDEKPVHRVSVGRFAMGKYEVTVGEFRRFVKATGYKTDAEKQGSCLSWSQAFKWVEGANWRSPGFSQAETHPVTCVSWNDGVAYAKWLSQQTGKQYRLPTEAEWEYAARAGTETKYWWGNKLGSNNANCWNSYCKDSFEYTAPVGSFAPNPFKLYDMLGNLWEWTCSEYESKYSGKEQRCAKNVNKNNRLSLRGGSWNYDEAGLRSANRDFRTPTFRDVLVGLRVARLL
jgi:formylglycine-generating enzyme required for sulfatase activity